LPTSYPSPDGQGQVSVREGTWLETDGKPPVQIIPEKAVQVIWRPDSQGFFLLVDQILYYVSLPEAKLMVIDEYVNGNQIHAQWLDAK
jgi:hypothetical protein